jgi:hypothetical protein
MSSILRSSKILTHDLVMMQLVERIPSGPFASELCIMVRGVNIVVIKPLLYFLSHWIRNKIIDDQVNWLIPDLPPSCQMRHLTSGVDIFVPLLSE